MEQNDNQLKVVVMTVDGLRPRKGEGKLRAAEQMDYAIGMIELHPMSEKIKASIIMSPHFSRSMA